jgi:hypothetical protein
MVGNGEVRTRQALSSEWLVIQDMYAPIESWNDRET